MKKKAKEWLRRYLPSEIAAIIAAFGASYIAFQLSGGNKVVTAVAGAWSENLSFFSVIIFRDARSAWRQRREKGKPFHFKDFLKILGHIFVEFGFAEVFDVLFFRPFFMYFFPILLGNYPLGILAGKIAADITFYVPAIMAYELKKKYMGKKAERGSF